MTATLLFASLTGLLTWRQLAPRVATIFGMLAAITLPGWPHAVIAWICSRMMNLSNWLATAWKLQPKGSDLASGFPALVAAFIIAVDMHRTKGKPGRTTIAAGILFPFLVPGFPGELGYAINTALKAAAFQAVAAVGGLIG